MSLFSENIAVDSVAIAVTILVIAITYMRWKLKYWCRVGLPTLNPTIPFGDCKEVLNSEKTFGEKLLEFYQQFKNKGVRHGGIFMGLSPWYVPVDPEIIKHILQVDFQHFANHGVYIDEKADPLSGHLFNLEDAKWRNMRIKLTPTFTSGKMKRMFQTLADCTVGLKTIMDSAVNDKIPVDIKEVLGRFTTDIIGSTAFGLECNSLKDPNSAFRKYGKRIFEDSTWERFKDNLQLIVPHGLLKMMKYKTTKNDVEEFFMKTVQNTVTYREKNNIFRKDFMHLLLQLKNRGTVSEDKMITDEKNKTGEKGLTINELAAQAFIFFAAGFETSSTTMTFALYEIATNPDIQDKLREEINTVLAKYDHKLTYDGIMEMTYMQKIIDETLRKYPPLPILIRACTKDDTIPNSKIQIRKGTTVIIPVLGLHMDSDYYPDPQVFDPERFSEENKSSRQPFTWLPFGEGPRICIGLRFGVLQSKVGLAALLKKYHITVSKKTKLPLVLDKKSSITAVEGGVWLDVKKLK